MTSIQSRQVFNRIFAIMAHTTRYAFKGESRLASDAGVSKSAVCRLLSGKSSPSFVLVALLAQALQQQFVKYPLFRQVLCGLSDNYYIVD